MYNILAKYGISEALLQANGIALDTNMHGTSSEHEVREALRILVPRRSGLELTRLGGRSDGGYLAPNDLANIEACFSPGTNNFKRFEDELAETYGIKSFMCDFSSDEDRLQTPLIPGFQTFEKKWLDINGDPNSLRLDTWVCDNSAASSDLILQMDIEGAEYRNIIAATVETLSRFRIIILELHDVQEIARREFLNGVFMPALRKISSNHASVHAHPNNCCGQVSLYPGLYTPRAIEITFLRKDRFKNSLSTFSIPHHLDESNVNREPPIHLQGIWLSEADDVTSRLCALEQSVDWLTERVVSLKRYNNFLVNRFDRTGNVALGKVATQSSLSIYSTEHDSSGAVDGIRNGLFGFHTNEEQDPWWMVDLGAVYSLETCVVFNRMDGASARADTLEILTSLDGEQWILSYSHRGRPTFGGVVPSDGEPPLLVDLNGSQARFLKLSLSGYTALHLDEVEIYGRPLD